MVKKKSAKIEKTASITMQINNAHFHAEGDSAEVTEKFKEWLDEQFRPAQVVGNVALRVIKAGK